MKRRPERGGEKSRQPQARSKKPPAPPQSAKDDDAAAAAFASGELSPPINAAEDLYRAERAAEAAVATLGPPTSTSEDDESDVVPEFMRRSCHDAATFAVIKVERDKGNIHFRLRADIDPAWMMEQHEARRAAAAEAERKLAEFAETSRVVQRRRPKIVLRPIAKPERHQQQVQQPSRKSKAKLITASPKASLKTKAARKISRLKEKVVKKLQVKSDTARRSLKKTQTRAKPAAAAKKVVIKTSKSVSLKSPVVKKANPPARKSTKTPQAGKKPQQPAPKPKPQPRKTQSVPKGQQVASVSKDTNRKPVIKKQPMEKVVSTPKLSKKILKPPTQIPRPPAKILRPPTKIPSTKAKKSPVAPATKITPSPTPVTDNPTTPVVIENAASPEKEVPHPPGTEIPKSPEIAPVEVQKTPSPGPEQDETFEVTELSNELALDIATMEELTEESFIATIGPTSSPKLLKSPSQENDEFGPPQQDFEPEMSPAANPEANQSSENSNESGEIPMERESSDPESSEGPKSGQTDSDSSGKLKVKYSFQEFIHNYDDESPLPEPDANDFFPDSTLTDEEIEMIMEQVEAKKRKLKQVKLAEYNNRYQEDRTDWENMEIDEDEIDLGEALNHILEMRRKKSSVAQPEGVAELEKVEVEEQAKVKPKKKGLLKKSKEKEPVPEVEDPTKPKMCEFCGWMVCPYENVKPPPPKKGEEPAPEIEHGECPKCLLDMVKERPTPENCLNCKGVFGSETKFELEFDMKAKKCKAICSVCRGPLQKQPRLKRVPPQGVRLDLKRDPTFQELFQKWNEREQFQKGDGAPVDLTSAFQSLYQKSYGEAPELKVVRVAQPGAPFPQRPPFDRPTTFKLDYQWRGKGLKPDHPRVVCKELNHQI